MRYLTVTATHTPNYSQVTTVQLYDNVLASFFANVLDELIAMCFADEYAWIGSIMSVLGISVSNLSTWNSASLTFTGASSWTRDFTQIYDFNHGAWSRGAVTEFVTMGTTLVCIDPTTSMTPIVKTKYSYRYSDHFNDFAWMRENAVYGYENSLIVYDVLQGSSKYYYGNQCIINHPRPGTF